MAGCLEYLEYLQDHLHHAASFDLISTYGASDYLHTKDQPTASSLHQHFDRVGSVLVARSSSSGTDGSEYSSGMSDQSDYTDSTMSVPATPAAPPTADTAATPKEPHDFFVNNMGRILAYPRAGARFLNLNILGLTPLDIPAPRPRGTNPSRDQWLQFQGPILFYYKRLDWKLEKVMERMKSWHEFFAS
jgi:hypothetical protein